MHPPLHRILGFILIVCSTLANIPVQFHFTNGYAQFLLLASLAFFSIFSVYTFHFLCVRHYIIPTTNPSNPIPEQSNTNITKNHISIEYVKMIQNYMHERMRIAMFLIYYLVFLGSWAFPTYMPDFYQEMSIWQKTMFAYNYTMTSFTVMYLYEHKNMNKYLSLGNVNIYNENDELVENIVSTSYGIA
jgi:hypothetical protein